MIALGERFLRERGLRDVRAAAELDRRRGVPARLPRAAGRVLRAARDRLDEDCRERFAKNPLRVLDCKVDGGKDFVLAAPEDRRPPVRAVRGALRGRARRAARAGVAYELEPRLVRGLDYYTRTAFEFVRAMLSRQQATLSGVAGTTVWRRRSAARRPRASGSRWGWIVCCSPWRQGVAARRARARLFRRGARATTAAAAGRTLLAELCATPASRGRAFEERPLKAQLKMADRAGAAYAAILGERELPRRHRDAAPARRRRPEDGRARRCRWLARAPGRVD